MVFTYDTSIVRGATFSRGLRLSTILFSLSTSAVPIALGAVTFGVQSGLSVSIGQRIRATLAGPPIGGALPSTEGPIIVTDPSQFIEGPVTAYSGSLLTLNADLIGGNSGTTYSSWQITALTDLTGGTFDATMHFSTASCSGRTRPSVALTVVVTGDPASGVFQIRLTDLQTAALTLGTYTYEVLFTPAASSDKLLLLRGSITVTDF